MASYRYGAGAARPPAGRLTTILKPQQNLASIHNPVAVWGGADAEQPADVRSNAPKSVLTFGRAISGDDYETVAALAPGVTRARAYWTWDDAHQRSLVKVYVGDDAAAGTSARSALAGADDPNRPVTVAQATPIELTVTCTLSIAPDRVAADVVAAATAAIDDPASGLFSPARMAIGQPLYASQIEAALLVAGADAVHGLSVTAGGSEIFSTEPVGWADPGEGSFYVLAASTITPQVAMAEVRDGYDEYYADRLWQLIPGVYRARDSDDPDVKGPLQELLVRIGAQVAVVRRSIDRLWADQSIETSDDWVIPYIGDLLDTNLVNGLDPRGQRLDVAKTIHYRRRKGTLAVLEEIARDVTGWDAHLVEAFRRLSRTRHSLDPPVGPGPLAAALPTPCLRTPPPLDAPTPLELLQHEGLVGPLTGTPPAASPTCARSTAPTAPARRSTSTSTPQTCVSAEARSAGTASRSCSSSSGACRASRSPAARPCRWPPARTSTSSTRPAATCRCSCRRCRRRRTTRSTAGRRRRSGRCRGRSRTRSSGRSPTPAPRSRSTRRIPTRRRFPPSPGRAQAPRSSRCPVEVWPEVGQFEVGRRPGRGFNVSYQYGFPAAIGAGPYDRTLLGDPPPRPGPSGWSRSAPASTPPSPRAAAPAR